MDTATDEKTIVEDIQREERKQCEIENKESSCKYFDYSEKKQFYEFKMVPR